MSKKTLTTVALLCVAALLPAHAFAVSSVPEIDGALSLQAIALMGGLVYLLKRKK
ncbi:hypothetical protein [Caenimonas koreensis]|uniref:PEP-CTERM protein-sorting domain-containing protein n=1 Tax=Caenimonas koreensis DSM 17982 TaxID=1121255 RepID=A0A844B4N5_9BURK|nr:hypothetical protein [Caenimonas koreensis]MRD46639.1 hypothetical protein [Caenimonas koreensis DSM 17982]